MLDSNVFAPKNFIKENFIIESRKKITYRNKMLKTPEDLYNDCYSTRDQPNIYTTEDNKVYFMKNKGTGRWTWFLEDLRKPELWWKLKEPYLSLSKIPQKEKFFSTLKEAKIHAYLTFHNVGIELNMKTRRSYHYSHHILNTPIFIISVNNSGWKMSKGIDWKYKRLLKNKNTSLTYPIHKVNKKQFIELLHKDIIDQDLHYLYSWMWK